MGSHAVGSHRTTAWLDPSGTALAHRLIDLAVRGLPRMYRADTDEFAFTRIARARGAGPPDHPGPPDDGSAPDDAGLELRGASLRYAAIVALGAHFLAEPAQRRVLGGHDLASFITLLVRRAAGSANLGDLALVCWAAAQSAHADLPRALRLLRTRDPLDDPDHVARPEYVVEAAWVVSALAASHGHADVEDHLTRARDRLLGSVVPGSPVFPHASAPGLVKAYRSHVACFADQVYPIQALARLHRLDADPAAFAAAQSCAAAICQAQGEAGQWWWHYDARTGKVIEGYPVYTVHQHAMAPMALLDLAEAGGPAYRKEVRRGLAWIAAPAELGAEPGADAAAMILDDAGVTWRKVYRGDPHKVVRGLHTMTTRAVKGMRVPGVGLVYRPGAVDRECRPYELGWLLFAWLGGIDAAAAPAPAAPAAPADEFTPSSPTPSSPTPSSPTPSSPTPSSPTPSTAGR